MVSVLDADILSVFAAYVMMRRGCLVQLLIPNSTMDDQSSLDRQLALARKLRRFVTRENYRAFILKHAYQSHQKMFIRLMCLNLARRRRFKGIVFADVDGSIHFGERLLDRSREFGLPVFQPLVGLGQDDLIELGRIFDVEWTEIKAALSAEVSTSVEPSLVDPAEFTVEEISL
jgi:adenylyl- and sulfurtransferase ThiI